jgi:cytidylate kinase
VIVAIDGPAGSGKSTLARRLALELGLPYVNTGATYRAVAREAIRQGVDPGDEEGLERIANRLQFDIDSGGAPPGILVDGSPPGSELSTREIESVVSRVSAHPRVRAALRGVQRRLAAEGGVVEGRDIGRVVFPDADVKIFLRADPSERAARRQRERGTDDPELAESLGRRDGLDARVNPLVAASDAIDVDTTGRTIDEVFEELLRVVRGAADR